MGITQLLLETVFLNLCLSNPSVVLRLHLTPVMQSGTSLYSFDIILKRQNQSRLAQPADFWFDFRRIESLCPPCILRCAPNFSFVIQSVAKDLGNIHINASRDSSLHYVPF